jgi:hypothetical protein
MSKKVEKKVFYQKWLKWQKKGQFLDSHSNYYGMDDLFQNLIFTPANNWIPVTG